MPDKLVSRLIKSFGWRPDLPDHRDLIYSATAPQAATPPKTDLRDQCPPVYDQINLGSCTANAIAALVQFLMMKNWTHPDHNFPVSRLFIYYLERVLEGSVGVDAGATLRDGMKVAATIGCPHERFWPYEVDKFADHPPAMVYADARRHRVKRYERIVPGEDQLKQVLASGFPAVFGFSVYESMMTSRVARTGIIPYPRPNEALLGGHAVLLVGYDDTTRMFLLRNSWSVRWGLDGYAWIPYEYLTNQNMADDFWTASKVA